MQLSNIPAAFQAIFAHSATSAYIRSIPLNAPAATATDAPAGLDLGFQPVSFQPEASGGIPPNGKDFNGLFNQITAWCQWQAAGGASTFNSTFSAAIGGYPQGARIASATVAGKFFISLVDNNTTNPEASGATNWLAQGVGGSASSGFWEYTPGGFLEQHGTVSFSPSNAPNVSGTFSLPTPFLASPTPIIVGTPSQAPSGAWAAATCIMSFPDPGTVSWVLSTANAAQNFAQGGTISWIAKGRG